MTRGAVHTLLVVGALLAVPARAESRKLAYNPSISIPIASVATVGWFGSELLKKHLAPIACRWCNGVPAVDTAVRNALVWQDTKTPNMLSNVSGFVLVPLAGVGLTALAAYHNDALGNFDDGPGNFAADTVIIAEATAIAADLNQISKFLVGRERPFVHALSSDGKRTTAQPSDNNLSFYSGHTNMAFALAVSSGTVASMRGYKWAPGVWATGLSLAATTGYLRIAADKHYFSDVMTGAVIGSVVGFAVPYFFHRADSTLPVQTGSSGQKIGALSIAWTF